MSYYRLPKVTLCPCECGFPETSGASACSSPRSRSSARRATARPRAPRSSHGAASPNRAGATKPMLYRHFPGGKAEIYMEVLDDHLQSMMRKLGEAMGKAEAPLDALRRGIDAYLRFAEENPEAFHLLAETSAELDPGIVDRLKEVRSTIADGLADTIGVVLKDADLSPEGTPVYAHVLLGGVESVVAWWLETKLLERSAVVTYLLPLPWRGFGGR